MMMLMMINFFQELERLWLDLAKRISILISTLYFASHYKMNNHHHPNQQSRKDISRSSSSSTSSSSDEIQKKYRKKYQKLLPKLEHVTVDSYIMITEQLTEVTNDKMYVLMMMMIMILLTFACMKLCKDLQSLVYYLIPLYSFYVSIYPLSLVSIIRSSKVGLIVRMMDCTRLYRLIADHCLLVLG